jgi:hypothetical protein
MKGLAPADCISSNITKYRTRPEKSAERVDVMTGIGLIRYASGDWTPGNPYVLVRIEADQLEEPQDLSIGFGDVGAFVTLLLALSGKAGTGEQPGAVAKKAFPLALGPVGLGQAETGADRPRGQAQRPHPMPPISRRHPWQARQIALMAGPHLRWG